MPPITVMIKPVSSACNMRCAYCFYADVSARRQTAAYPRMTDATLETLIRRALRYAEGSASFVFQGGEPTLAGLGFFQKVVEFEREYNTKNLAIHNSIQTNGYDLPDDLIDFLVREHFLIGVSLDGTPSLHDRVRVDAHGEPTSARVLQTIRRLQQKQAEFNILCVVNQYVAHEPDAVMDALLPYSYIQFIPCLDSLSGERQPWSLTEEAYAEFLKRAFDRYARELKSGHFISIRNFDNYLSILTGNPPENCAMCGRCAEYYVCEADGSIYPCDFYVLDEWKLGNILEDSFFKLAKTDLHRAFLEASYPVDPTCRQCSWYALCRGGCRRDREPFIDGLPSLNRHCQAFQDFLEYAYPIMKSLLP